MTAARKTTDAYAGTAGLGRALTDLHLVHVSDGRRIAYLEAALAERKKAYEDLHVALANSRRIGAAIGIVMTVIKVTEDDAFAVLARISQAKNTKLRFIADEIVLTGSI